MALPPVEGNIPVDPAQTEASKSSTDASQTQKAKVDFFSKANWPWATCTWPNSGNGPFGKITKFAVSLITTIPFAALESFYKLVTWNFVYDIENNASEAPKDEDAKKTAEAPKAAEVKTEATDEALKAAEVKAEVADEAPKAADEVKTEAADEAPKAEAAKVQTRFSKTVAWLKQSKGSAVCGAAFFALGYVLKRC